MCPRPSRRRTGVTGAAPFAHRHRNRLLLVPAHRAAPGVQRSAARRSRVPVSREIPVLSTIYVTELLVNDGTVFGAYGFDLDDGSRYLIHADAGVRADSVDYLKKCITMISELRGGEGGGTMSIVPSEVGKVKEMASPEEEWAWAIEGLKEVNEHAGAEGVRVAIEPLNRFETNFLNRHDQALLLANEVGDNVGVCLDLYHMNQEEADVLQAFRNAGDKLFDVHVADNNRMACGQGQLDWATIIATLKDVGYDGSLTVEFVPPLDRTRHRSSSKNR